MYYGVIDLLFTFSGLPTFRCSSTGGTFDCADVAYFGSQVDIFAPLGSSRVVLRPKSDRYTVSFGEGKSEA